MQIGCQRYGSAICLGRDRSRARVPRGSPPSDGGSRAGGCLSASRLAPLKKASMTFRGTSRCSVFVSGMRARSRWGRWRRRGRSRCSARHEGGDLIFAAERLHLAALDAGAAAHTGLGVEGSDEGGGDEVGGLGIGFDSLENLAAAAAATADVHRPLGVCSAGARALPLRPS